VFCIGGDVRNRRRQDGVDIRDVMSLPHP